MGIHTEKNEALRLVVGLTGGIGSGKSLVAEFFREWGSAIVDADILARDVLALGTAGLREVTSLFGEGILLPNNSLNRKALGALVFSDSSAKIALEKIVHPLVRQAWLAQLQDWKDAPPTPTRIITYVVPLLYESNLSYQEIDRVVLVTAPDDLRVQRVTARDNLSIQEANVRIASQMSDIDKRMKAHYEITNDSSKEQLRARANLVFQELLKLIR